MAEVLKIGGKPKTREELLRARLPELIATMPPMPPLRKPVPTPEARTPLVGKVGEVAKANPKGVEVRVTARDADGVTYVQPPIRPREIVTVLEVERGTCRASLSRNVDCATGDVSFVEYRNGYRPQAGAQHEYNPMDGLRRPEDE